MQRMIPGSKVRVWLSDEDPKVYLETYVMSARQFGKFASDTSSLETEMDNDVSGGLNGLAERIAEYVHELGFPTEKIKNPSADQLMDSLSMAMLTDAVEKIVEVNSLGDDAGK